MRLLLFILLLAANNLYSQITITQVGAFTANTANSSAFNFTGQSFTAGKLYLYVAITSGTTNPGTVTSTTLSWTSVASVGDATRRIQIFRCVPASSVTGESVGLGTFGGGSSGYIHGLLEITGTKITGTNGSDAIVQSPTVNTTGTNPSITLSAISNNKNSVIAFFGNDINPFGGTPETDWTEMFDSGYATPTSGGYVTYRYLTTDNTVNVTAASSTYLGVALELAAEGRRIISSN